MDATWKAGLLFIVILALGAAVIAYNWYAPGENGGAAGSLVLSPDTATLAEGASTELLLSFTDGDGTPISAEISWNINASGGTGAVRCPPETNASGQLNATYDAPADVDVRMHNVTVEARAVWERKTYVARARMVIVPVVRETAVEVSAERATMTAGETVMFTATLRMRSDEGWRPLAGQPLSWTFFDPGGSELQPLRTDTAVTNAAGKATVPFFISDVNETMEVLCWVRMPENLSGEEEFEGCDCTTTLQVQPETPGAFPVVLVHGWGGSVADGILNYTWWNLTQKLQRQGHTILDFDTSVPGIQYLRYAPGWSDHHIPWIAARVSDAIRHALVMNGYSPDQTFDIVSHSMGGLVSRFMAEHPYADVDYWNSSWQPGDEGTPWYGDGDSDVAIGGRQIDDLVMVGTPNHGVPPNVDDRLLDILSYLPIPWWACQTQDMVYHSTFLEAMGYRGCDIVDYHAVGTDIGFTIGEPQDFDGDGVNHTTDGLVPTESPCLEGCPLYIVSGKAWPMGTADHISQIAVNGDVHRYILEVLA
ncbi:MAG: hypothetical protein R6U10_04515 [Thermoplasmatota archaeon]